MDMTSQDENGIVLMVLRDTYDILSRTPNFSFDYNAKVKLQKLVFLIAETMDIPLTRSWYRHGPFVHNTNVNFEKLNKLPETLNAQDVREISKAEKILSDVHDEYMKVLKSLVPHIFFLKINDLLVKIYKKYAPEEYRPIYLTNLTIESIFKTARTNVGTDKSEFIIETDELLRQCSALASNIATFEGMDYCYAYADDYITTLEKALIKMSDCKVAPSYHLKLLTEVYESSVWVPLTLNISINTLIGLNAEDEQLVQWLKLEKAKVQSKNQLVRFKRVLKRDGLMASIEERTKFFKTKYGEDKDFVDAVSDVWKAYK